MPGRSVSHLSRREFMLSMGAAGGALLSGCNPLPPPRPPQTAVKVHRLGWLNGSTPAQQARATQAFRQALGELGYVEGQNLIIEYRWGEGSNAPLTAAATELARLPVEAFVVPSSGLAQMVDEATGTVPIVFSGAGPDPIAMGVAASLARPAGNITGVTTFDAPTEGRRLQLLKESAPAISRVAIFWEPGGSSLSFRADDWDRTGQLIGVDIYPLQVSNAEDFDAAFETAARAGVDALFVYQVPFANAHRARLIQLAERHCWPAIYPQRQYVDEGGLMAYEASQTEIWRRVAAHVDKILRGAKPADIPIERPTRFDFVVNLTTADSLGIQFPESTRVQITEVVR